MSKPIVISGSTAFDAIMTFNGHFQEHFLAADMGELSVSFLAQDLHRRYGGNAANISYTLALLGENPWLCSAVGYDYEEYRRRLIGVGVEQNLVRQFDDIVTATCFITTDNDLNQITIFYAGAMARAAEIDIRESAFDAEYVAVVPNDPKAMDVHLRQALNMGAKLVFAPAQQIPALSDDVLRAGIEGADVVIVNEYETLLLNERIGVDLHQGLSGNTVTIITKGNQGSLVYQGNNRYVIAPVTPRVIVDPTGAGDAYVAGLLAGLRQQLSLPQAAQCGSLAGAIALENAGPQEHLFTLDEFLQRYEDSFGDRLSWQKTSLK